jgi:hypothetical protein
MGRWRRPCKREERRKGEEEMLYPSIPFTSNSDFTRAMLFFFPLPDNNVKHKFKTNIKIEKRGAIGGKRGRGRWNVGLQEAGKGTHDRGKERKELQLAKERREKEGMQRGKEKSYKTGEGEGGGGALRRLGRRAFPLNAFRGTFLRIFLCIP